MYIYMYVYVCRICPCMRRLIFVLCLSSVMIEAYVMCSCWIGLWGSGGARRAHVGRNLGVAVSYVRGGVCMRSHV